MCQYIRVLCESCTCEASIGSGMVWSMWFKIAFETKDFSWVSWILGTISALQPADLILWPNSPWHVLQVILYSFLFLRWVACTFLINRSPLSILTVAGLCLSASLTKPLLRRFHGQVTWDEPDLLQGVGWISPWQVKLVATLPLQLLPLPVTKKKFLCTLQSELLQLQPTGLPNVVPINNFCPWATACPLRRRL